MDIFGLTPYDAALSVLGLNYCQIITDFLFRQTSVGLCAFIIGFLLSLWQVKKTGQYRPLIVFGFIILTAVPLFLPNKEEGSIKSAVERYAQSIQTSQELKDHLINTHQIPVILSFVSQFIDSIMIGIIHAIDVLTPAWANYLTAPFRIHQTSFNIREEMNKGIADIDLERQLNIFLHDYYLPALSNLKHSTPAIDLNELWPGHARISVYYSSSGQKEWAKLKLQLMNYLNQNPSLSEQERARVINLTQMPAQTIEEGLIKSMVIHEFNRTVKLAEPGLIWKLSAWTLRGFPYMYGGFNVMLYAAFPMLILALAVTRDSGIIIHYLKNLLWDKTWILSGALCFYGSMLIARLQAQSTDSPAWVWEHPYYCVAAAVMLVIMPIATFLIINQLGGNTWGTSRVV